MRWIRLLLVLAGAAAAGYGGWLLRPQLAAATPWLLTGPLVHDLLVAPLVGLTGLALGRVVADRGRRAWLVAGLAVTATLLLVAVPLLWRPAPAPPNPGLQDRAYLSGLVAWLVPLWAVIAVRCLVRRPGRGTAAGSGTAARGSPPADEAEDGRRLAGHERH